VFWSTVLSVLFGAFCFVPAQTLIGVKLLTNSFGLSKIQFKTQMCLNGKTHLCFAKHFFCFAKRIYVFNLWGLFVELYTFGMTLIFLKNEIGFSNKGDFKKIWNLTQTMILVRIQYCPPPFFPQSSVFLVASMTGYWD
jgi:hypothetical protein